MKILTLLFTYNTSLNDWLDNGTIDRELLIYTKLLKYFDKIYFITYGLDDKKLQSKLPSNIIILPKKYPLPNFLYSLIIPFAYRKELKEITWVKTNQIIGSWTAVLIKLLFRKKINIRTGYTESLFTIDRNILKQKIIWLLELCVYKFANFATVTSIHQRDFLNKLYSTKNVHVISNGIDTELFKPLSKEEKSPTNSLNLLSVGRLHKEKNFVNLVKALVSLPNIHLTIVGTGELKTKLHTLQDTYNLNITFIDKVPNAQLPKIYTAADIYIQPALYEGNPKTILEAMSCGLPIIATDITGINNVLTHKKTGYLCNIDTKSIKNAIITLKNDLATQKKLGKNARKYILKNYDLNIILKKEISLYKKY
jgi:glycosyltransferase involved in cell wall biosynthesis